MVSTTDHAKGDYSSIINILRKLSNYQDGLLEHPHKKQNIEHSYGNVNVWKKNTDYFCYLFIYFPLKSEAILDPIHNFSCSSSWTIIELIELSCSVRETLIASLSFLLEDNRPNLNHKSCKMSKVHFC